MSDWNPELYLKYGNERTQASVDLISRIRVDRPGSIIDIGCGPGNSTQVLASRFPDCDIIGLDNSPGMIDKAKNDYPNQKWIIGDASQIGSSHKYDIVFSNSVIQWIPDHFNLIPRLFGLVKHGGALALQIPEFYLTPLFRAIGSTAGSMKWKSRMAGCGDIFTYHDACFYYDILSPLAGSLEMWETTYIHVLDSQMAVMEWIRSTGMRPYLDQLPDDGEKALFEREVLEECRNGYPVRTDGKVLFHFPRLFMIAYSK